MWLNVRLLSKDTVILFKLKTLQTRYTNEGHPVELYASVSMETTLSNPSAPLTLLIQGHFSLAIFYSCVHASHECLWVVAFINKHTHRAAAHTHSRAALSSNPKRKRSILLSPSCRHVSTGCLVSDWSWWKALLYSHQAANVILDLNSLLTLLSSFSMFVPSSPINLFAGGIFMNYYFITAHLSYIWP